MITSKEVFNIASFKKEWVGVEWNPTAPFASKEEGIAYFGDDLLKALNDAKLALEQSAISELPLSYWRAHKVDAEGSVLDELNGKFAGTVAGETTVKDYELNLARQMFGFARGKGSDFNSAARESARNMIAQNKPMRDALILLSNALTPAVVEVEVPEKIKALIVTESATPSEQPASEQPVNQEQPVSEPTSNQESTGRRGRR